MSYDPIADLVRLGYTWREAAFLQLVGVNSGFFLRRQYCDFLNRKLGSLPQQLAEKGAALRHIEALDYGQRRHVYHLKSRAVYAILGIPESDHHRTKGDVEIKTRLMTLDYLLANRKQPLLTLEEEKIAFFVDTLRVPKCVLPSRFAVAFERAVPVTTRYFAERFPIHNDDAAAKGVKACFTYIDYGALSVKRFARFLETYKPLLRALGSFGIVYVADSPRNLPAARVAFDRAFPKTSRLLPLGLQHLTSFFAAQTLWDRNDPNFSQQDLAILKEGERVYTLTEHIDLRTAWLKGGREFQAQLARTGEKQVVNGTFASHILQCTYPIFGNRYKGKRRESAPEPRIQSISNFESIAS